MCIQTRVLSLWGFLLDARNIKWSPFSVLPTTAIVVVICVHFSTHSIMFNFCFFACCIKLIWPYRLLIYSKGHCERSTFFCLMLFWEGEWRRISYWILWFFCSLAGNMASILEVDDNMGHTFIQVLSLYKGSMPLQLWIFSINPFDLIMCQFTAAYIQKKTSFQKHPVQARSCRSRCRWNTFHLSQVYMCQWTRNTVKRQYTKCSDFFSICKGWQSSNMLVIFCGWCNSLNQHQGEENQMWHGELLITSYNAFVLG